MNIPANPSQLRRCRAFTLVELIVVIAIIMVLAALIFPTVTAVKHQATRKKVKAELRWLETAIESYKSKYHVYPPDNPGNYLTNQLYFELIGTETTTPGEYRTLDQNATIRETDFAAVFGSGTTVRGFQNHTRGTSDEGQTAQNFFSQVTVPPQRIGRYKVNSPICIFVSSVKWPDAYGELITRNPGLNPFQYNSSSPTNNPATYDLWVDVVIGGKTNRISNWSEKPQIL